MGTPFVVLVSTAVVAAIAWLLWWAPRHGREAVAEGRARLATFADDRQRTIDLWVRERTADMRSLSSLPQLTDEALAAAARAYRYEGLWLVDPQGAVVAAASTGTSPTEAGVAAVRAQGRKESQFLFVHEPGRSRVVVTGPGAARDGPPGSVLVGEVDPALGLYTLLGAASLPLQSGESLLVRREAKTLTYLSPLRFDPAPRAGEAVPDFAADVSEPVLDYRGVPVLATFRPIAGTPWSLVVKVDESEVLAEHRATLLRAALGILTGIVLLAGLGILLWRGELAARAMRELRRRERAEAVHAAELHLLEMIASGAGLSETLETLVVLIERQAPGMVGSVLFVKNDRVWHGAAPHLPTSYLAAVEGQPIGPEAGSCGTAAYLRTPVIATDIATDPRWRHYKDGALAVGLRACWSMPILAADETVYGTFALYYGEPRSPSPPELRLIERAAQVAAIAIARHRTEESLRQSESEMRAIFDNAAIGMALLEPDGRLARTNPALERFLGYPGPELRTKDFIAVTHPEDRGIDADLFGQLVNGARTSYELEKRYIHQDGRTVWGRLNVSMMPAAEDGSRRVLGMVEDVTEDVRLREEVRQAQKLEAIGRLAGGIAHDFNNLLGVIMGYAQLHLGRLAPDDKSRAGLQGILAAAERGANLTRQLLAFSRKQTFALRTIEMNDLVKDLGRMLPRMLGDDVSLELSLHPDSGTVRADPSQVDQILMNLAVNARDAMPNGGRFLVETRPVELDAAFAAAHAGARAGPHVRLRARDTGHGMSPEVLAHIFEPFFTTKPVGQGTGLGLSTVYGIVQQMGGCILVESAPGEGACFDVYIPRAVGVGAPVDASGSTALRTGSESVLLVEDEEPLRRLIAEQLAAYGYKVLTADGGDAALRLAGERAVAIDILLTDVVMPDLTGVELARRVRALRPSLRVLYMSGYPDGAMSRRADMEPGAVLVSKPFTGDALAAKLREVLAAPAAPVG